MDEEVVVVLNVSSLPPPRRPASASTLEPQHLGELLLLLALDPFLGQLLLLCLFGRTANQAFFIRSDGVQARERERKKERKMVTGGKR